jgi:hypothetical protein
MHLHLPVFMHVIFHGHAAPVLAEASLPMRAGRPLTRSDTPPGAPPPSPPGVGRPFGPWGPCLPRSARKRCSRFPGTGSP